MTQDVSGAVELLRIAAEQDNNQPEGCIDSVLQEPQPLKRERPTQAEIKARLEEEYLTPPTAFGPEWLDKFQRYVRKDSEIHDLVLVDDGKLQ